MGESIGDKIKAALNALEKSPTAENFSERKWLRAQVNVLKVRELEAENVRLRALLEEIEAKKEYPTDGYIGHVYNRCLAECKQIAARREKLDSK